MLSLAIQSTKLVIFLQGKGMFHGSCISLRQILCGTGTGCDIYAHMGRGNTPTPLCYELIHCVSPCYISKNPILSLTSKNVGAQRPLSF